MDISEIALAILAMREIWNFVMVAGMDDQSGTGVVR
jgi:hypothetical protein